jgi:hypothetical protein
MTKTFPDHTTCARCRGLCIKETMMDYSEEVTGRWTYYRCMNCGWETDSLMEQHRASMQRGIWPAAKEIKGAAFKPEVEA